MIQDGLNKKKNTCQAINVGYVHLFLAVVMMFIGFASACISQDPNESATPIGDYPTWGQNFTQANSQTDLKLPGQQILAEARTQIKPNQAESKNPARPDNTESDSKKQPSLASDDSQKAKSMHDSKSRGELNAEFEKGKSLYTNLCMACHTASGQGNQALGPMPNFQDSRFWKGRLNPEVKASIQKGKGNMPAFGERLSSAEYDAVLTYIRSFSDPS